jgi:hypothetical protein
MSYIIKGFEKQTTKNAGQRACIMGGLVKPKKPRKPKATGYKLNREEDHVRPLLQKLLERDGWVLKRVEPYGYYGKKGFSLGDWWGHHKKLRKMAWIEAKSIHGLLKPGQEEFRRDCIECGQPYFIVRPTDHDVTGYRMDV